MIDFKGPLRIAYYSLLNGALTSGANAVAVADVLDPITDTKGVYVILLSEGGFTDNTHQSFMSWERMRVDIIARGTRVSSLTVDRVADQILQLVTPTPEQNGLPVQPNMIVQNLYLADDRYVPYRESGSVNVARRMLTFAQLCTQSDGGIAPAPTFPVGFKSPIFSPDFSNATDYNNTALGGLQYYVFLNDAPTFLLEGTEWHKLPGGGFAIDLAGFDATLFFYTIYIVLK